jgi:quercetin dioxygenase-like cupin family protein
MIMSAALSTRAMAQETTTFPKGEKATNVHHVGTVYLNELTSTDSVFTYSTSVATFEPGARLDWHTHPGGQILMITAGTGYYQERGKPRQTLRQGDVIKCQPGIEHWHGATPSGSFGYLATSPSQKGKTIWFKRVTDAEYGGK